MYIWGPRSIDRSMSAKRKKHCTLLCGVGPCLVCEIGTGNNGLLLPLRSFTSKAWPKSSRRPRFGRQERPHIDRRHLERTKTQPSGRGTRHMSRCERARRSREDDGMEQAHGTWPSPPAVARRARVRGVDADLPSWRVPRMHFLVLPAGWPRGSDHIDGIRSIFDGSARSNGHFRACVAGFDLSTRRRIHDDDARSPHLLTAVASPHRTATCC